MSEDANRDARLRFESVARFFVLIAAVFAALAYTVWCVKAEQARKRNPADVRAVLNRQVEAWNRGDLEGFMAGYWKSHELTFCSGGTVTKGWQPTFDRYEKRYRSEGKEMGRLTFDEIEVEVLTDEVALVRGRWKLALSDGKPEGLFTLKMGLKSDGWRVVYDHTSVAETPK